MNIQTMQIDFNELMLNAVMANVGVYCKDRNSRYLACNEYVANELQLTTVKDIAGKTDHSFSWSQDRIHELRSIDAKVIRSGLPLHHTEKSFINLAGKKVQFITHKMPLRDKASNIIGVFGVSVDIHQANNNSFSDYDKLTGRETEVLDLLTQGMCAKEIAAYLSLSKRTIEHHIENIKDKMNVSSKYELLIKMFHYFKGF